MPKSLDPLDCSPPDSSVHGNSPGKNTSVGCHFLLQGIFLTQESNPNSRQILYHLKVKVKSLSRVQLFATPWAVAYQAPLSMGFSRQVYWSGLPFPSPGNLPNPGIKLGSPALQTDSLPTDLQGKPKHLVELTNEVIWAWNFLGGMF